MINRLLRPVFMAMAISAIPIDTLAFDIDYASTALDHVTNVLEAEAPLQTAAADFSNVVVFTSIPVEKRKNLADTGSAFDDYTKVPAADAKFKQCLIYSLAREDNVLPGLEKQFGFEIENREAINPRHIAQWVFFHELRHCAQKPGMEWTAAETDADLYAIQMIKRAHPDSNIDKIIMAFRALSPRNTAPEGGHANAVFLASALQNGEAKSYYSVNSNQLSFIMLDVTVYERSRQLSAVVPPNIFKNETEYLLLLNMISLDLVIKNPKLAPMAELARVRRDSLAFLMPTLSGMATQIYDAYFAPTPAQPGSPKPG